MTLLRCIVALLTCGLHGLVFAQSTQPFVIMIGIDGLRPASIDQQNTPNLYRLSQQGVTATSLTPAMPSKTFVNFYSLATGLHPEHHGIVSNYPFDRTLNRGFSRKTDIQDPQWWGGEPIWITAEKQNVKAATYFWVGSEVAIDDVRPTYWKPFKQNKDYGERVTEVLQWLTKPEAQRPHLVTLYFSAVDSAAHDNGVNSSQEIHAINNVDKHIGDLITGIHKLGLSDDTNIVVVSDHGMADLADERVINLDAKIDWSHFNIPDWHKKDHPVFAPYLNLYGDKAHVDSAFQALTQQPIAHLRVLKRGEFPANYHFDHPERGPDLMLLADTGWSVYASENGALPEPFKLQHTATHGYDNQAPEMAATFIANGPAFAKHSHVPTFDNVEVYNLLACALGIKPAINDGDLHHVRNVLSADKQTCLAD